jgi:hypothetical protein
VCADTSEKATITKKDRRRGSTAHRIAPGTPRRGLPARSRFHSRGRRAATRKDGKRTKQKNQGGARAHGVRDVRATPSPSIRRQHSNENVSIRGTERVTHGRTAKQNRTGLVTPVVSVHGQASLSHAPRSPRPAHSTPAAEKDDGTGDDSAPHVPRHQSFQTHLIGSGHRGPCVRQCAAAHWILAALRVSRDVLIITVALTDPALFLKYNTILIYNILIV